jgi:hypothetical protein
LKKFQRRPSSSVAKSSDSASHAGRPSRHRASGALIGWTNRPRHAEPAIGGPFHRIEQGLAAQRPEIALEAVIDRPPVARRPLEQRGMAARPPGFLAAARAHDRLCGQFSHGPWIERERAAITMCPVGGPAVPPTAVIR